MTRVYWDTMLFIYLAEGNTDFSPRIRQIRERMRLRGDRLCASLVTLCELLVFPCRHRDWALAAKWRELFSSAELEVLPLVAEAADPFASLRAFEDLDPPDALHLAIAAAAGVDLFLTNDRRLQKLHVPGISFIAGLDAGLY